MIQRKHKKTKTKKPTKKKEREHGRNYGLIGKCYLQSPLYSFTSASHVVLAGPSPTTSSGVNVEVSEHNSAEYSMICILSSATALQNRATPNTTDVEVNNGTCRGRICFSVHIIDHLILSLTYTGGHTMIETLVET